MTDITVNQYNRMTIRQALRALRGREYPEIMNCPMRFSIEDGTELEVFNAPSAGGGHIIGKHAATRYRHGIEIAIYDLG